MIDIGTIAPSWLRTWTSVETRSPGASNRPRRDDDVWALRRQHRHTRIAIDTPQQHILGRIGTDDMQAGAPVLEVRVQRRIASDLRTPGEEKGLPSGETSKQLIACGLPLAVCPSSGSAGSDSWPSAARRVGVRLHPRGDCRVLVVLQRPTRQPATVRAATRSCCAMPGWHSRGWARGSACGAAANWPPNPNRQLNSTASAWGQSPPTMPAVTLARTRGGAGP